MKLKLHILENEEFRDLKFQRIEFTKNDEVFSNKIFVDPLFNLKKDFHPESKGVRIKGQ